jgi:hypothetical protein
LLSHLWFMEQVGYLVRVTVGLEPIEHLLSSSAHDLLDPHLHLGQSLEQACLQRRKQAAWSPTLKLKPSQLLMTAQTHFAFQWSVTMTWATRSPTGRSSTLT